MKYFEIEYSDGRRWLREITNEEAVSKDLGPVISLTDEEHAELQAFIAKDVLYQARWRDAENEWYINREKS
jgi:hypothetical protein